jgi:glycosyltransferase
MKVSIITVCLNAGGTIGETVESVLAQDGVEIEYIIVDGGSQDSTLDALAPYRSRIAHLISEKDDGLYDAMNKGMDLATGDVVGFLNADDVLMTPETIQAVVHAMERSGAEFAYGDVEILYKGTMRRIYSGRGFDPGYLRSANVPPHPSIYIRTELLRKAGHFDTRFRIAADAELMLRIMSRYSPRTVYLPMTLVRMRGGGISNRGLSSYWSNSRELLDACLSQGIEPDRLAIYGRVLRRGREVVEGSWSARSDRQSGSGSDPSRS